MEDNFASYCKVINMKEIDQRIDNFSREIDMVLEVMADPKTKV